MAAHLKVVDSKDSWNIPSKDYDAEAGSEFGWFDRLMFGWRDGKVFDYADWEARDIAEMMGKDYKARQLENVLTLPIISATRSIIAAEGDTGEAEFLQNYWEQDELAGGCKTPLDLIVNQMTSAFAYKRAYFEKVWTAQEINGKTITGYEKVAWRPQTTCRIMRDPTHGGFEGFEQEAYYIGPNISALGKNDHWPIVIPKKRAFVYIHGVRRDPINGSSDLEIAYWAWKTKQKIMFLWFQFLENMSLPRVVVAANDINTAQAVANEIAKLKSSGVVPVANGGSPDALSITSLDVSGKGSQQFSDAINYLDNAATNAVLAGFLNLTDRGTAISSTGSFALSKDASDFYLQMKEADAREMEHSIRKDLFAPFVRANRGPKAVIPHYKFEPLNDEDKSSSVAMFQALITAPTPNPSIPTEFIAALAKQVADYLGLDGDVVEAQFQKAGDDAKAAAAQQSALGASPAGQGIAAMGGATQAAQALVSKAKQVASDQGLTPGK